jgi:branched-chain amino acid transport system ATP-binding protein
MTSALAVLQREHRGLAAVLYCFEQVLGEIRLKRLAPDFALFEAIVQYIQDFPDRFHHPKEDELLFPLVRERAPETGRVLDELQDQHHDGVRLTNELKWKLAAWKDNGDGMFSAFDAAARAFIDFQRRHIGAEEREILPAARRTFTEADWERVNNGFAANEDPLFGRKPKAAFDALFSKITCLAPEPHGLGARKAPAAKPPAASSEWDRRRQLVDLHWI